MANSEDYDLDTQARFKNRLWHLLSNVQPTFESLALGSMTMPSTKRVGGHMKLAQSKIFQAGLQEDVGFRVVVPVWCASMYSLKISDQKSPVRYY